VDAVHGDFHVLKEFAGIYHGTSLPDNMIKAMGLSGQEPAFIGAYPVNEGFCFNQGKYTANKQNFFWFWWV